MGAVLHPSPTSKHELSHSSRFTLHCKGWNPVIRLARGTCRNSDQPPLTRECSACALLSEWEEAILAIS